MWIIGLIAFLLIAGGIVRVIVQIEHLASAVTHLGDRLRRIETSLGLDEATETNGHLRSYFGTRR